MTQTFRRLVTGHDATGRSVLLSDTAVGQGTLGNFNFWHGRPGATPGTADRSDAVPFFPGPGETVFRIFQLPPPDPAIGPEEIAAIARGFFAGVGWPGARTDTSRHPLMHQTPTTDYIVLLSGEVSLLLDEGEPIPLRPYDAVVQRATNHAWVVTGKEPATLLCVMVGRP